MMQNFQLIWQFKKANGSASSFRKCIFIRACYGQPRREGLFFLTECWYSQTHSTFQTKYTSIGTIDLVNFSQIFFFGKKLSKSGQVGKVGRAAPLPHFLCRFQKRLHLVIWKVLQTGCCLFYMHFVLTYLMVKGCKDVVSWQIGLQLREICSKQKDYF